MACDACQSMMRFPVLSTEALLELYEGMAGAHWADTELRGDQRCVRGLVEQFRPATILDVGCGSGGLLAGLHNTECHGIEPGVAAACLAAANGVTVLGSTIDAARGRTFDCVTAVDVLEHVARPVEMARVMAGLVNRGGRLIISTGDPEHRIWRLLRSAFWYSSYQEHVTFASAGALSNALAECGLRLVQKRRTRHELRGAIDWLRKAASQISYAVHPALNMALCLSATPTISGAGLFRDHMLLVFERAH